jgi:hypothetical protein
VTRDNIGEVRKIDINHNDIGNNEDEEVFMTEAIDEGLSSKRGENNHILNPHGADIF